MSAGGGVKLMPVPRFGLRLDGRLFTTFVEAEGRAIACSPGICLVAFEADIVLQAEFTAGIVVVFCASGRVEGESRLSSYLTLQPAPNTLPALPGTASPILPSPCARCAGSALMLTSIE